MNKKRLQLATGSVDPSLAVIIIEPCIANGYQFPAQVLQACAEQFNGAPCFADHARGPRSVRDLVGLIEGAHWSDEQNAIAARFNPLSSAAWLVDAIRASQAHPSVVGLSADMWVTADGHQVETIEEVLSVDIVIHPAAGGRFTAQTQIKEAIMPPEKTEGQVRITTQQQVPPEIARQPIKETPPATAGSATAPATYGSATAPAAYGSAAAPAAYGSAAAPAAYGSAVAPAALGSATAPAAYGSAIAPAAYGSAVASAASQANTQALRTQLLNFQLAEARLPAPLADMVRAQFAVTPMDADAISTLITRLREAWAQSQAQASIKGLGQVTAMRTPIDRLTLSFENLMGIGGTAEHRNAERLTGIREMYDLLTGDYERYGLYRADRVTLANATTTTMANIVANVLNKVMLRAFESRPQWWKPIAYEEDFSTLNEIKWLTVGGFSDLDTVAEGGAYTEKTWDDYAESASFVKKGNYIGITLEMIDRDDVAAVRAIPRRLGHAANRTLSAAVAALFTANAGAGPTLADTKALFHADHGNLGSTALSADEWDAVIQAMYKQTEFHSSKRLGVRPRWCLVPIELEKTALTIFTSDQLPGTPNNDANVRRYSAQVITVPEWTDATDWAAAADPGDLEGVCIGYRYGRAPEIFVAQDEQMGSMFTNDEMRVKVRFFYAVGIGDYRALYKENVAGG